MDAHCRLQALQDFVIGKSRRRDHGAAGSLKLRARLFLKAFLSLVFQRRRAIEAVDCDVLLVHPSRKSFRLGRKQALLAALRSRGLAVEEFVEEGDFDLVRGRQFVTPASGVPALLRWDAAHAAYLLSRYKAKVIVTERNGWIIPSLIKLQRKTGPRIVHLAHSVPSDESSRYDYFDYDYYLLFGKSSLEYLSALEGAFGECVVKFAGPYFFTDREGPLPVTVRNEGKGVKCLFLGSGPDYEVSEPYLEHCSWIAAWLISRPDAELWVKVHPRGSGEPWRSQAASNSRIKMIPPDTMLDACIGDFDFVLSDYTNAVLDVSRFGTPFILLGEGADYFSTERFGIPRARSSMELTNCIDVLLADVHRAREMASRFFDFHVHEKYLPLTSMVNVIERLAAGGEVKGLSLSS
ncbi:hypothetical protein [Aromatoleum buckelii]|uniref:Uncharacterized protein n=1 Tax=Aromatoleum buckelii TaxID=200254 RepID=A0ABX1N001_9RHOO|nr:hypothetical protein [Aromatoleum buckelii]MCK0510608.1 hypothetical protein [Aromatoleum buckelii]